MKFLFTKIIILTLVISPVISPFAYAAVMTSGTYSIERDSINFEGINSSSGGKILEDTGGEIGTGNLEGNNYDSFSGYQQSAVSITTSGSSEQRSSSGRSSSRRSVNVLNFTATPLDKTIKLSWDYPKDSDISSVRVVRSDKFFPLTIDDGEIIFEGNAFNIFDYNVIPGTIYYYSIFAKTYSGEYSSGVLSQALIPSKDKIVTLSSEDIFKNIADAMNVDPIIKSLTLADFDFIQDDIRIAHSGNTVSVDGKKQFTVSLDYRKVPEVLKTIAITLVDPDDTSKIFTFLLRVNKDKTAYQATLGALNKSGNYRLNAIILDYKNQGMRRFDGSLRVLVFDSVQTIFRNNGVFLWWNYSILLAISIITVLCGFVYYKKRKL